MVRRVIALRDMLAKEEQSERWEYISQALYAFYMDWEIHSEAVALAKQIHAKLNDADSAAMLAEALLAAKQNGEAAKVLAALGNDNSSTETQALRALATARHGDAKTAKELAAAIAVAADAEPKVLFAVARAQAVVGNAEGALGLLTRCFEGVPPSLLEGLKAHTKESPDFAALASTAGFAKVMQTQSKVPESACSGGSGCANCPNRGGCSKAAQH